MFKGKVLPSGVHVLHSSPRWHIYWNLFKHGYRSWEVNFRRSKVVNEYVFWVSFGTGQFSISFRPTKRAPDARKSAPQKVSSNKKGSAKPAHG